MRWKVAGINFEHFHMGDNLRMAKAHPEVDLVGVCDERPEKMADAIRALDIPADRVFTDWRACLEQTRPDVVILCPATRGRASLVEEVAPYGVHILLEKPFAASLAEADRMIKAVGNARKMLAINWPLRWSRSHAEAKNVIDAGIIGTVNEVHWYGGNRGPLWHTADKVTIDAATVEREKPNSWFYKRASGGGSLLDYLGYGVTLGTWYMGGREPIEVTASALETWGLEVDEQSVAIARYDHGLSTFQTRWGTFTDPWTHQPQPKCGFVIVGSAGTIASYDYEPTIRIQTRDRPEGHDHAAPELQAPERNPIEFFLDRIKRGGPIDGPLGPDLSRIGQKMMDAAVQSVAKRQPIPLHWL